MKKVLLLVFAIFSSLNMFAINSYEGATDEGRYAKSSESKSSSQVEFELGTIWGYDFQTEQSGFREVVDLDFKYFINPFTIYKSDLSIVDYSKPYGVLEVSGGEVFFELNNEVGDQNTYNDVSYKINYELIYGKIVLDPFYLLVASSEKGNHYTRNNGWSFSRSTSSIRADIAHIGYNVSWEGMNTGFWSISGAANPISDAGASSMLGFGAIVGSTEILLQTASEKDWETNEDNQYEVGLIIESNPVGNLTVKGQANTGFNYDVMPINFAVGSGYMFELNNEMSLTPFVGFDGTFIGTEDDPMDKFNSETSVGVSLNWPGSLGWGYEPLNDKDCDRFSGVTAGVDIFNQADFDPSISFSMSLFEETNAGIIPLLGASIIYEINDITDYADTDRDYLRMAYGVYIDYNIMDMVKPFVRAKKTSGLDDAETSFESGVEYSAIPNTVITIGYDTADITNISDNKGLFYTEFKVVL